MQNKGTVSVRKYSDLIKHHLSKNHFQDISTSSGASGLQTCAPFVLMQRLEPRSGGRALLILKIGHVLSHRLQAGLECLEHAVARGDIRQRRNQTPTFPLPSFKSPLLQNKKLLGIDSIDVQIRPPLGTSTGHWTPPYVHCSPCCLQVCNPPVLLLQESQQTGQTCSGHESLMSHMN